MTKTNRPSWNEIWIDFAHSIARRSYDPRHQVGAVVVTEDNSDFTITTNHDIPIGHKVALTDFSEGDTVIKYGVDIGRSGLNTTKGDHVHTHNLKTKRW